MSKLNFDPNELDKLVPYLESLDTVDSILENSHLIYSSPVRCKKDALENIIRFGDISLESLDLEHSKITNIMNAAVLNHIPVQESVQRYLISMADLIRHKRKRMETLSMENDVNHEMNVYMMESQLFDMDDSYAIPTIECTDIGTVKAVAECLGVAEQTDMITPTMLLNLCRNYFSHDTLNTDTAFESFVSEVSVKVMNVLEYETKHNNYKDLPVLESLKDVKSVLENDFFDKDNVKERISQLFDKMEDDMKSTVQKHFEDIKRELISVSTGDCEEPVVELNPFDSIYSMTPFPVGARYVHRTIDRCLNASSEEELIESLNEFGMLTTICETFGESILTEGAGSLINKARRSMAQGGKKVAAVARKVGDEARRAKDTTKRITDPMVRFIENTYDSIAKADMDERKKIVMTQGLKGKITKLLKWIKDVGIMTVAGVATAKVGFTVGTVIAAISLVVYLAQNAILDSTARRQVLQELENELKITQEKIEDSRGDESKQKKYELMRIEAKLQKEISRIKHRWNY